MFLRWARHVAFMVTLLLLWAGCALAQPRREPIQEQPAQQSDADAIQHQQYERDIKALFEEVGALREQAAQAERSGAAENNYWFKGNQPPVWSNWILVVIAGIAGVTAYIAFTHQRDAVRLTQRADVLVDGVVISTYPNELTGDSSIAVMFKNFGATRADNCQFGVWFNYAQIQGTWENPHIPPMVLGSGDSQRVPIESLRSCMDKQTFMAIRDGTVPLTFIAEAKYKDVFGRIHTTRNEGPYLHERRTFQMTKSEST